MRRARLGVKRAGSIGGRDPWGRVLGEGVDYCQDKPVKAFQRQGGLVMLLSNQTL